LAFQQGFEESIDLHFTASLAAASKIIVAIGSSKLIAITFISLALGFRS